MKLLTNTEYMIMYSHKQSIYYLNNFFLDLQCLSIFLFTHHKALSNYFYYICTVVNYLDNKQKTIKTIVSFLDYGRFSKRYQIIDILNQFRIVN